MIESFPCRHFFHGGSGRPSPLFSLPARGSKGGRRTGRNRQGTAREQNRHGTYNAVLGYTGRCLYLGRGTLLFSFSFCFWLEQRTSGRRKKENTPTPSLICVYFLRVSHTGGQSTSSMKLVTVETGSLLLSLLESRGRRERELWAEYGEE